MMKGRTVNMVIKKTLHDSITVPTLTYVSEKWTWNEGQRPRIQALEMSYLRGAYGLNRMDGESNESVYGHDSSLNLLQYSCVYIQTSITGKNMLNRVQ